MKQWILLMFAIVPLQADAQAKGDTPDPRFEHYQAAYHAAAMCDCSEPLLKYLYSMEGSIGGQLPGTYQQGGRVWLATVMVLNERWGTDLGLVGEHLDLLDLALVDQLHDWIEEVQVYDGVKTERAGLREMLPGSPDARIAPYLPSDEDRGRSRERQGASEERERSSGRSRSSIPADFRILCDECADPACDSLRIANAVAGEMCNGYFDVNCVLDSARLCDDRITMRSVFLLDVFDALFWGDANMDVDVRALEWERADGVGLGDERIAPTRFKPEYGRWIRVPDCYNDPRAAALAPVVTTHTDLEKFSVTVIDTETSLTRKHTYFLTQARPITGFTYQQCHPRNTGGSPGSGCNCSAGGPCGHGTILRP